MRKGTLISRSPFSHLKQLSIAAAAALAIPLTVHAGPPSEEMLGKLALAEEFSNAGVKSVDNPKIDPAMVRQSVALLRAACNECDFEPRFPRLLKEAYLQLKDPDGAIWAIQRYRAIQLPEIQNDQFAQVELIDLYTGQKETLGDKEQYLQQLLGVAAIPAPVRSHIAWARSNLLKQKFDTEGAEKMLTLALQLNPLNPEALQSQYVAAQASGDPRKRAAALVALLKSNPAQPLVMGTLADELASVGQPDLAVTWYKRSFQFSQDLGLGLDPGRYLNYAAALYAMDQTKSADQAAATLLSGQPANIGAATVRLLSARQAIKPLPGGGAPADPDVVQNARTIALAALSAQMGELHAQLNGVRGPAATQAATTQPLDLVGDIGTDAPKVRDLKNQPAATSKDTAFCTGYSEALADLIFYYTYFDPQPVNANKLLDSLRLLRPADDVELARLEGFAFLADGKRDEAKVKFSAVADHDPLSKMGLLLMDPPGPDTSAAAAKLVTDHPAGLLGAILLDGLRDKGGKPATTPDATAVAQEAAGFPLKLLDLLDRAHTPEFYNLVAEPLHASSGFDEPQLVRVSIKNVGDYDLSVGTDAAIRSDLWFDVATQGGSNPTFPGVAYDHIAGPLVLPAHHLEMRGTDQVVRVDSGPLNKFLVGNPTIAVSMLFSVFTNPIGQQAGVAPGPGGYRKQFSTPMERRSSPLSTAKEVQDLIDPVMNGRPDQKIHTIELLTDYVQLFRRQIVHAQAVPQASTPAPAAGDLPAAGDAASGSATPDGGAGGVAPPPSMTHPAHPEVKLTQANIDAMNGMIGTFTGAIRGALRDQSPLVRYWAQAKLAELDDSGTRQATAMSMIHGKDWEQRMLGLVIANDLPHDQTKAIASVLKDDSVAEVKSYALATIDVADLPPSTQPVAGH
jgi:hypothetical protein